MCRVVPRRRVPRLSQIRRPRFDRRFRKRHGMSVLPDWFLVIRGRLTRFQRCLTILIVMIRVFYMGTMRWNARLFVLMPFSTNKKRESIYSHWSKYLFTYFLNTINV